MYDIITDAELSAGIIDFDEFGMPVYFKEVDNATEKERKLALNDFIKHRAQEMSDMYLL